MDFIIHKHAVEMFCGQAYWHFLKLLLKIFWDEISIIRLLAVHFQLLLSPYNGLQ